MGHQVEYFIDSSSARADEWLSTLPGRWADSDSTEFPNGEFEWCGKSIHIELSQVACRICVPEIKYSYLIGAHVPSVEWVNRFDDWLSEVFSDVQGVRLDELLRLEWEATRGCSWKDQADPVVDLRRWLLTQSFEPAYFRFLPVEDRPPGS